MLYKTTENVKTNKIIGIKWCAFVYDLSSGEEISLLMISNGTHFKNW